MDCDKANGRMYRYLDGEITIWRHWWITRHLDRCPPCAHGYAFEVELREVIATRCRDSVPEDVKRRIAQAIEHACNEHRTAPAQPASSEEPRS